MKTQALILEDDRVLNDGIKHAGRCVTSPYNEARDIVFGNSFLYPVALQEVDKNEKNFL